MTAIHPTDREHLLSLHSDYRAKARMTGCSTAAASFLLIGALIVIGCSGLVLTLPAANPIQHFILPGLIPGASAALLSIPFIVNSVLKRRASTPIRKEAIDFSLQLLFWEDSPYQSLTRTEARGKWISKNLLHKRGWPKEYNQKIVTDLKARLDKEEDKRLIKALDAALQHVMKRK